MWTFISILKSIIIIIHLCDYYLDKMYSLINNISHVFEQKWKESKNYITRNDDFGLTNVVDKLHYVV